MAGQDDTREFDRIVARLRAEDPGFASRVDRHVPADPFDDPTLDLTRDPGDDHLPRRRLWAGVLGVVALVAIVLGGWTGLIIAIVVTVCAVRLIVTDRTGRDHD